MRTVGMSKLRQLDVFIGTNTKIGRLILPVGTKTEFSFIYEEDWKHTGFPISPHIPFDDQSSPVFCYVDWRLGKRRLSKPAERELPMPYHQL
ncbi:HipA N-terminal domain-containing protein [Vibrio coralliilyticus]|uniref:HipA N-terminal domain-containing protein n=2 Tax=Vibrio coralliilyticus TaxID=190893 RepID=UPI003CE524E4